MSQKSERTSSVQQWILTSKKEAQDLLSHADILCQQLFLSGDLSSFLSLLQRFHQYDYRNLLLILDQFPTATCLAAFNAWKKQLSSPSAKVLKDDAVGKGIRLLAPFTEQQNGKYRLTWHRVLQFDISQTNAVHAPKPFSPYILDQAHLTHLSEALRSALGFLFHKSLLLTHSSNPTLPAQLSYRVTSEAVVLRSKEPLSSRVQIISEAIGLLYASKVGLPAAQHLLFSQCLVYCLVSIWHLKDLSPVLPSGSQITDVEASVRSVFLDHLQRALRMTEETVACVYLLARQAERLELPDEDVSTLLGLTSSSQP